MVKEKQRRNEETLINLQKSESEPKTKSVNVNLPSEEPVPSTSGGLKENKPVASTSRDVPNEPVPSTSRGLTSSSIVTKVQIDQSEKNAQKVINPSDLVFENDDHMWHLKLVPKRTSKKMPLLSDILNFLLIAFNFMLNHLKSFYNPRVSIT